MDKFLPTGGTFALFSAFAVCALGGAAQIEDHPAVPTAGPGEMRPHVWIKGNSALSGEQSDAAAPTPPHAPSGFWPVDMMNAYGITANGGAGATVAIVDAYDSPNALKDLNSFSLQFALPTFPAASDAPCSPTFSKVSETGGGTLPKRDKGWEVEINLDTQWVHAIAPCANIVLVEALDSTTTHLLRAVAYAKSVASVVSMSWGGGEGKLDVPNDSMFLATGVTFLASSGDNGTGVSWPASSTNVIGVGGTNLTPGADGGLAKAFKETAWKGSGGGCSAYEPTLSFQAAFLPSTAPCAFRGVPDVSISGGNLSAVAVMVSKQGGWTQAYGTSLAVQMYAGLIAIANGIRATPLDGTLATLYTDAAGGPTGTPYINNFRDITAYTKGKVPAKDDPVLAGWDYVTGLGSPLATSLLYGYLTH